MKIEIDVEEFARQIKEGKGLSGKDGVFSRYTFPRCNAYFNSN